MRNYGEIMAVNLNQKPETVMYNEYTTYNKY